MLNDQIKTSMLSVHIDYILQDLSCHMLWTLYCMGVATGGCGP